MNNLNDEIPQECVFPGCEADAKYIEMSLLLTMCTEHKEWVSAKLPILVDHSLEWRDLHEPLDDLDIRKASANVERTIFELAALKIRN